MIDGNFTLEGTKLKLKITHQLFVVMLISLLSNVCMAASDYVREKRWADEILPGLIVGEPVYLKTQTQHRFLGLYADTGELDVALIVVHGMGLHPDWGMIGTLRRELYDHGYSTLSIQMPILAADASYTEYPALFPEAAKRLDVAANFLKKKGYKKIAIVSHSNGSRMSRVYMVENPEIIDAWVALSLTQGDTFAGIKVPVFDLYGELDLQHVLDSVQQRKTSMMHADSRQHIIKGADHFFNHHENDMVQQVSQYLKQVVK